MSLPLTKEAARFKGAREFWAAREAAGDSVFIAKGVIFTRKGKEKPVPAFALKKSVTIPRRRYLGLGDAYGKEIEERTAGFIDRLLKG